MLHFTDVSKSYADRTVLHVDRLEAAEGRTLVVIGASGSGKSTLLRIGAGLIEPDRGTVRVGGDELRPDTARALRRRMGFVIQDGGLFPHLTARDNVTLLARTENWESGRIDTRLGELVALTDFPAEGLDRWPAQLSGGQRQRVALMRALFHDPELLLFDEPLGALDPLIRADLQRDLREIFRRLGRTVVLVTHDLAEARFFADRIALLNEGRIEQAGGYDDLQSHPATPFVERFLGAQRTLGMVS